MSLVRKWEILQRVPTSLKTILVFAILMSPRFAYAQELASIRDVFTAQHILLKRIDSLDVRWTQQLEVAANSGAMQEKELAHFRVRIADDRFRVDINGDGTATGATSAHPRVFAFDLKQFQLLEGDSLHLEVSATPFDTGYCADLPFLIPYGGIFLHSPDRTFTNVRDNSDIWNEVMHHSTLLPPDTVEGHQCVHILSTLEGRPEQFSTYFASDADWYPVRYISMERAGVVTGDCIVTEMKSVMTSQGMIPIPAKIVNSWAGGKIRWTYQVDPATLVINSPIAPEVFTLSRGVARSFVDRDDPSKSYLPDVSAADIVAETMGGIESTPKTPLNAGDGNTSSYWESWMPLAIASTLILASIICIIFWSVRHYKI